MAACVGLRAPRRWVTSGVASPHCPRAITTDPPLMSLMKVRPMEGREIPASATTPAGLGMGEAGPVQEEGSAPGTPQRW